MEYRIEFDNNESGTWLAAHHDFDDVDGSYQTKDEAIAIIKTLKIDNPDISFRIVEC